MPPPTIPSRGGPSQARKGMAHATGGKGKGGGKHYTSGPKRHRYVASSLLSPMILIPRLPGLYVAHGLITTNSKIMRDTITGISMQSPPTLLPPVKLHANRLAAKPDIR